MNIEEIIQHLLTHGSLPFFNMKADQLGLLIDHLKAEADRHWRIDPNISLKFAEAIIQLGHETNITNTIALGTMAYGDALKLMDRPQEAWDKLDEAGRLYQQAGDDIGWARTRIGKLAICVDLSQTEIAIADAESALAIFQDHGEVEKCIRLKVNLAVIFNQLSQYQHAIEKCQEALDLMQIIGEAASNRLPIIYFNMGTAYQGLGNLRTARESFQAARTLMVHNGEEIGIALADLHLINIAQALGHNKLALKLLHDTVNTLSHHKTTETGTIWHLTESYLFLNRFTDARDLAEQAISQYDVNAISRDLAFILIQLAAAQSGLGQFEAVYPALQRAAQIFEALKIMSWLATTHLYRAQAAIRENNLVVAKQDALIAAEYFKENGETLAHAKALFLSAQIDFLNKDYQTALLTGNKILEIAQSLKLANLKYQVHLLLGKLAEQMERTTRALRHYQVANLTIERIQRSLVLTSRSDFLADKQEPIQRLLRLQLSLGQIELAFSTLERAKAQVWLGYLTQLDQLRWITDTAQSQALVKELNQLREEHHWYYRVAYDESFREKYKPSISSEEAAKEARIREHRLRNLTEQLYLQNSLDDLAVSPVVTLREIQENLSVDELLVAYYSGGQTLWAFVIDASTISIHQLPNPTTFVEELWNKLQNNINRALRTIPGSNEEENLVSFARVLGKHLYAALINPFAMKLANYTRLTVVPYGFLHYLPFQLLHDDQGYLMEQHEIRILPTASIITRQPPQQIRGAIGIAYNGEGRLHHTDSEAEAVVSRFGGTLYAENTAKGTVLSAPPCQILHIAAHGQYRIDQPDFSYLQLADGPIFTDDLFQYDLRYELVTLSACETGRSRVMASDELIGLGRGFLFAGAGAILASLWPVDDSLTLELMNIFYHKLDNGASKTEALRQAQLEMMRAYNGLHPAFWGAFQLIGSADPLSKVNFYKEGEI